jgi:isopentenyldiphosphate isomerase
MFCGTFPQQLSEQEVSFGALMVVNDDEDEITSAEKLKLRTNKLKSVVYYFCVMCFRHHKGKLVQSMDEVVVFQRQKGKETYQSIYESTVFLRPAEVKFGKYFENEKNKVSINPCLENILGIRTNEDTIQF